jgi:hypothetical protein
MSGGKRQQMEAEGIAAERIAALEAECARLRREKEADGVRVASLTGVLRTLVGAMEAEHGIKAVAADAKQGVCDD